MLNSRFIFVFMSIALVVISGFTVSRLTVVEAARPEAKQAGESMYLPFMLKNFHFGPGNLEGTVVDAVTNDPLNGALVCTEVGTCMVTNEDGFYQFQDVPGGTRTIEAARDDYLPLTQHMLISGGVTKTLDFALSPDLAVGEYRIVLTWGQKPEDLDAHFWLPFDEYRHLFLDHPGNCSGFPDVCLDRDDKNGKGPETISVVQSAGSGTYAYAVLNFNFGRPGVPQITQSNAKVQVYNWEGLITQFNVPSQGSGDLWYVFDLDAASGEVVPVNCITYYPSDPERPSCGAALQADRKHYTK